MTPSSPGTRKTSFPVFRARKALGFSAYFSMADLIRDLPGSSRESGSASACVFDRFMEEPSLHFASPRQLGGQRSDFLDNASDRAVSAGCQRFFSGRCQGLENFGASVGKENSDSRE
jgi:hypothetical protein